MNGPFVNIFLSGMVTAGFLAAVVTVDRNQSRILPLKVLPEESS